MATSISEASGMTTYRAGSNAGASALSRIRGALPVPVFTAVAPAGAITWSDGGAGGTFQPSGVNNSVAVYTPRNKTQNVIITATDAGGGNPTRSLSVFATMPIQPQIGAECELDVETKIKYAKDRTRYSREEGVPEIAWVFAWDNRTLEDKAELLAFWNDHRKVIQFYLVDTEGNILNKVWFNSAFKSAFNGANKWAMSAAFKGVYEGVPAVGTAPLHLRINTGGYAVGAWQADQYYGLGQTYYDPAAINSSGVTSPAPDEVYKWGRYDASTLTYFITGLRPFAPYTVRLHWCANVSRTAQPEISYVVKANVTIPSGNVAIANDYTNNLAGPDGTLPIFLRNIAGPNVIINGIEVIEQ